MGNWNYDGLCHDSSDTVGSASGHIVILNGQRQTDGEYLYISAFKYLRKYRQIFSVPAAGCGNAAFYKNNIRKSDRGPSRSIISYDAHSNRTICPLCTAVAIGCTAWRYRNGPIHGSIHTSACMEVSICRIEKFLNHRIYHSICEFHIVLDNYGGCRRRRYR